MRPITSPLSSLRVLGLLLAGITILSEASARAQGTIWHVNAASTSPTPDGLTWATAFPTLDQVLTSPFLASGDQVRVVNGFYWPSTLTNPSDPRSATFLVNTNISIYGDFAGNEPDVQPPSPTGIFGNTILDGDIGLSPNFADNAYHVLSIGSSLTVHIEGFQVWNGNASGTMANPIGAGIFGGQLDSISLKRVQFANNFAQFRGGGLYVLNSTVTLESCSFTANTAASGGGLWAGGSSVACINSRFDSNTAGVSTSSVSAGGALFLIGGSASFTNCAYWQNRSTTTSSFGGVAYVTTNQTATFVNCSISQDYPNTPPGTVIGQVIYLDGSTTNPSSCSLLNSIVWDTKPVSIFSGRVLVKYCDIEGGLAGTGNINKDPMWFTGTLSLSVNSVYVMDAGSNAYVPADIFDLNSNGNTTEPTPFDINGNPRFHDVTTVTDTGYGSAPIVDMGAFEAQY